MGLEAATFIGQLVATNPLGADDYATADDHLRLIKAVLQSQFTSLGNVAVTALANDLNLLAAAAAAGLTATEILFLDGVTSGIQAQIDGKADSAHTHAAADIISGVFLAARIPTHTGDVTGQTALTIAANAVSLAKMADMATASFLGRNTAATGNPEVLSASIARAILNVANGANAYVHPNHSGDVTSVADGAQTIANNAVSLAKMADMATASFLGRNTVAAGDPEVLSATIARAILGVEAGSTADQSNAEIKTAYEANTNTNAFDDAEQSKLAAIEAGATADQSNAEIKTAYEANADTNAFDNAEQTKLAGIETAATADQTAAQIEAIINHDNLLGFVLGEHILHTSVSITAGTGLTGGGNISATRTLNLATDTLTDLDSIPTRLMSMPLFNGSAMRRVDMEDLNRIKERTFAASMTLVLNDEFSVVRSTGATNVTATVPPNSSVAFPIGTVIGGERHGTGTFIWNPGAAVTLNAPDAQLGHRIQYSQTSIRKIATNEWMVGGDLA